MGYLKENLKSGEQVVFHAKQHPIVFSMSFVMLGTATVGLVINPLITVIAVYGAFAFGIMAYISCERCEAAVTNSRVLIRSGFVETEELNIALKNIVTIDISHSFLAPWFNYGTVTVTDNHGREHEFADVFAPEEFKESIEKMKARQPSRVYKHIRVAA